MEPVDFAGELGDRVYRNTVGTQNGIAPAPSETPPSPLPSTAETVDVYRGETENRHPSPFFGAWWHFCRMDGSAPVFGRVPRNDGRPGLALFLRRFVFAGLFVDFRALCRALAGGYRHAAPRVVGARMVGSFIECPRCGIGSRAHEWQDGCPECALLDAEPVAFRASELLSCESCGVDETLDDSLSTDTESRRRLCDGCACEEADAVELAATRCRCGAEGSPLNGPRSEHPMCERCGRAEAFGVVSAALTIPEWRALYLAALDAAGLGDAGRWSDSCVVARAHVALQVRPAGVGL